MCTYVYLERMCLYGNALVCGGIAVYFRQVECWVFLVMYFPSVSRSCCLVGPLGGYLPTKYNNTGEVVVVLA